MLGTAANPVRALRLSAPLPQHIGDRILSQGPICYAVKQWEQRTLHTNRSLEDIRHSQLTPLYHSKAESMVAGTNCHSTFLSHKIDDFPRLV